MYLIITQNLTLQKTYMSKIMAEIYQNHIV
jgi:hypothetical protein